MAGQAVKWYLPDEIFLLLASLIYALVQRILEVNRNTCGNDGLILWLILVGLFVAVAIAKYVLTKNFLLALVGGLIMFVMGLGLHRYPLECVIKPRRGRVDWVPIVQAVFLGIPLALYVLILVVRPRA